MSNTSLPDPKVTLVHTDKDLSPIRTEVQAGLILATLPGVSAVIGCEREWTEDDEIMPTGDTIGHSVTLSVSIDSDLYDMLPYPFIELNDDGLLSKSLVFDAGGAEGRRIEIRFDRVFTDAEYDEWLRQKGVNAEAEDFAATANEATSLEAQAIEVAEGLLNLVKKMRQ